MVINTPTLNENEIYSLPRSSDGCTLNSDGNICSISLLILQNNSGSLLQQVPSASLINQRSGVGPTACSNFGTIFNDACLINEFAETPMSLSSSGSLATATMHLPTSDYSYPPPSSVHQQQLHHQQPQHFAATNFLPPFFDSCQQQQQQAYGANMMNAVEGVCGMNSSFHASSNMLHPTSIVSLHHQNQNGGFAVINGAPTLSTPISVSFAAQKPLMGPSAPTNLIADLYQQSTATHNCIPAATVLYSATTPISAAAFDSSDTGSGGSVKDQSLPTSAASDATTSSNNSSFGDGGGGGYRNIHGKGVKLSKYRKSPMHAPTIESSIPESVPNGYVNDHSPSTSKSADSTNDVVEISSGDLGESVDSGLAVDNSSPEHRGRCSSSGARSGGVDVQHHQIVEIHAQTSPVYGAVGSGNGPVNQTSSVGSGTANRQDSSGTDGNRSRCGLSSNIGSSAVGIGGPSGSGCGGGGDGSQGESRTSSPPALIEGGAPAAASIGPHAVYVHVNPGETLSVRVGSDIQHIPGPATVRMVSSHNSAPPVPLPLHVPPGHIVQQIVDESGVLRHLILSPQTPTITPGPFPCMSIPNGPLGPTVQFMPVQNGHHECLTPTSMPTGPLAHSPPPYFPQLPLHTEPHHICQLHINQDETPYPGNKRLPRLKRRNEMFPADEHESTDVVDDNTSAATSGTEDEEVTKIAEMLSKIQPPQVCEIGPRDALVQWQPLDCSEASACGGPFPQIDASEFTYEVMVFERKPDGENHNNYRCHADLSQQWLSDLKPSTEYFVRLRALLEERGLNGEPSPPIGFKTKPTHPDKPMPPRLMQRMKTALVLKWGAPCENGSRITGFHLEMDDSSQPQNSSGASSSSSGVSTEFREVFVGNNRNFKINKLHPSTLYRFRLAASNQHGKSEFSDVLLVQTSGAAPQAPNPPTLTQATSHSLSLCWSKRDGDEEFQLLMEDPHTVFVHGHGFLPVCHTHEISYVVPSLQKHKEYRFRLCVSNEEGQSQPSDVLVCRTLPSRPQAPNKPTLKGKLSSNSLRVSWEAPKDTGGGEIVSYRLEFDKGTSGDYWTEIYAGNEQEFLANGLSPGVTYKFRVACTSMGGESLFSEPVVLTTIAVAPGVCRAPTVHGKTKSNSVHLKWAPPETNGGAEISEYEINMEWAESPFSIKSPCIVFKGAKTDCVVGSLTPGRTYGFRVRAHNKAGIGHWSDSLECQTAAAPPECPTNVRCVASAPSCLHLLWDSPVNVNGAPIIEYRLQQASRKLVSLQVPDLLPSDSLVSNVCTPLVEECTSSATSSTSSSNVQNGSPPASVPSSPSNTGSTSGATIGFADLEFGPFVQIFSGVALTHEARGLLPANDYAFRVQAVNNAGISKFSPIFVVRTPPGAPDAPLNLSTETLSTTEICLYWNIPCDNGSPLIGFNLDVQPAPEETSLPIQLPAHCVQHNVENLKPESTYRFRVQAYNDVAAGPYSPSVRASTFCRPPTPPSLELVSATFNSLKLKWAEPKSFSSTNVGGVVGGVNETSTFLVEVENKTGAFSPVYEGSARSCKVSRLNESSVYRFRIRACASNGGMGPWSDLFMFKTTRTPPTAHKVSPKVSETGETSYQIEWQPIKMTLNVGEKLAYCLQVASSSRTSQANVTMTSEDFRTVFKGCATSFNLTGLLPGVSYRVRVSAVRCSDDGCGEVETSGPWSPIASFAIPSLLFGQNSVSNSSDVVNQSKTTGSANGTRELSDKQCAMLILAVFSVIALLIAFLLQRVVQFDR